MVSYLVDIPWRRIAVWAVLLGFLASAWAEWGRWNAFPTHFALRVIIVAAAGLIGYIMDRFFGFYVGMGTNVIESFGIIKFSSDTQQKIENGFIFVVALVGMIAGATFVH